MDRNLGWRLVLGQRLALGFLEVLTMNMLMLVSSITGVSNIWDIKIAILMEYLQRRDLQRWVKHWTLPRQQAQCTMLWITGVTVTLQLGRQMLLIPGEPQSHFSLTLLTEMPGLGFEIVLSKTPFQHFHKAQVDSTTQESYLLVADCWPLTKKKVNLLSGQSPELLSCTPLTSPICLTPLRTSLWTMYLSLSTKVLWTNRPLVHQAAFSLKPFLIILPAGNPPFSMPMNPFLLLS